MSTAWLAEVGIALPWAASFDALKASLHDPVDDSAQNDWKPDTGVLPSRPLRRMSLATRAALGAAQQIADALPEDAGWVFASSLGEGETLHAILDALCDEDIMLQPVRFQNAVHNAASGQWTILKGLKGPVTSIAAYDETFCAGLMKSVIQCTAEHRPVGLIVFDAPIPAPLHEKRPLGCAGALAFAFTPERTERSIVSISLSRKTEPATATESVLGNALWSSNNPIGKSMPLIEAILSGRQTITLEPGLHVQIDHV